MDVVIRRCLLNDLLKDFGWTQQQFADKLGMSRTQISDYANLRIIMSYKVALKIAAALHVDMESLYEWEIREKDKKE